MHCPRDETVYEKSYPDKGNQLLLRILGGALIVAGVLLLIFCIPGWAWLSFVAVLLIFAGALLLFRL